jgi:aryl sulfotransferase
MAITEASLPVLLASYPKSGNTWFRLLLANVKSRRREPVRINSRFDRADVFVSRAQFDDITMIESGLLTRDEVDGLRSAVLPALAAEAPPFTWFKTHEVWRLTPSGMPYLAGAGRAAVYVVRDPRDVAVSLAHHNSTSVDRAIDFMSDPDATTRRTGRSQNPHLLQKIGDWSAHVKSWLNQTDIPVYAVKYEDLRGDTAEVLAAALRFAGQEESRQDIERAVSHSDFSELRRQEDSVGFRERWSTTTPFFRRGEAGAWRDELTALQCARIEAAHHNVMIRLGYLPQPGADPIR